MYKHTLYKPGSMLINLRRLNRQHTERDSNARFLRRPTHFFAPLLAPSGKSVWGGKIRKKRG